MSSDENAKHYTRAETIARKISDDLQDAFELKKRKNMRKGPSCRGLPPLAASYRQTIAIREMRELERKLLEALNVCEEHDIEKQTLLGNIIKKAEAVRFRLQNAQNAFEKFRNQKINYKQTVREFDVTIKYLEDTLHRWARCGEDLWELKQIFTRIIDENECYKGFLRQVAHSDEGGELDFVTDRYEEALQIQDRITHQIEEKTFKVQETRAAFAKMKDELQTNINILISHLIDAHHESHHIKRANDKLEWAMKHMSIDVVDSHLTLQRVHKSAEQMIENLIARKVVGKSFRKKTLAQQFEAIREDYIKKKAVFRAIEKSEKLRDARKSNAVQQLQEYDEGKVYLERSLKRVDELSKKKKAMMFKAEFDRHRKAMIRRRVSSAGEGAEEYDFLKDANIVFDMETTSPRTSSEDEYDTGGGSGISLDKFSDEDHLSINTNSEHFLTTPAQSYVRNHAVSRSDTSIALTTASTVSLRTLQPNGDLPINR